MYVVVDPESDVVVGPFETIEQANQYFTKMATNEEWRDVLELISKTGKPFVEDGDGFVFINSRSENLKLMEVTPPESEVWAELFNKD